MVQVNWVGEFRDFNMAEGGGEERAGFSAIAKSQRKYGSTSRHMKRNEVLIKHIVSPAETLQGIALRYGVTMEQIKRTNKIWTNDSLFLRKTLDIPIPRNSLDELCWDENTSHNNESSHSENSFSSNGKSTKTNNMSTNDAVLHENSATLDSAITINSTGDKSDQSIADILIRIDSSIAQTRSQVEKREKKQEYYSDDNMYSPRRLSYQARMRQSLAKQQLTADPQTAIQPAAMTQGKKVQTSLQRHQREQDEMFEL